ncbi:NIPSNAP family protein [Crateriforma spongiae]|uniref:NIPSNAP family protein n=1 Tax=Crateriforma spongiae TaxID=2724528 RepID=UPI0014466B7D|nr:NIPSNAP family protein [Crateriforma spongiae]
MNHRPWLSAAVLAVLACVPMTSTQADEPELYEVRHYILGEQGDAQALDQYLADALIPALQRQQIGPVGAFAYPDSLNPNDNKRLSDRVVVVIPYKNAADIAKTAAALSSDSQYLQDADAYLQRAHNEPAFQRIQTELLVAMDCMKQLSVPSGTLDNPDRVYELRLYESANERLAAKKVDMFNNGEVPIFLDCDIQPIFIGQCLVGPQQPSLTYLTVYENDAARNEAWKAFRVHPDWKVLSKDKQYANTVSRIDKLVLTPKPYSQM